MSAMTVDDIYQQAKQLSLADRRQLFERLLEDIAPEPPNTFHTEDELKQMLRDGMNSPVRAFTDETLAQMRQEVRRRLAARERFDTTGRLV